MLPPRPWSTSDSIVILLCTIGFAGKTAEEFFQLLESVRVEKVIDIRQHREGQLSGFAKYPDVAFFLNRVAGIGYCHELRLAPTPDLLKIYRDGRNWPAYKPGFLASMKDRNIPHSLEAASWPSRAALLGSEPGPEKCHRRLVADLLAAHWRAQGHNVEILHLVATHKKSVKTRLKKQRSVP